MAGGPDSTAVRTALWRALHTLADDPPHVLVDLIGLEIAGVDEAWPARPDMDVARTSVHRASIVARARAAEDTFIASGARQYVVLGAGLDTFAQRCEGPALVFEIDAPAPQSWTAASGHPWLSLLTPDQAAGLAHAARFADVEVVTSGELHERYFAHRPDGLSPIGGEDLVLGRV